MERFRPRRAHLGGGKSLELCMFFRQPSAAQ